MLAQKTILLVDDDAGLCDILAEELSLEGGYRVRQCHTLAEAEAMTTARDARFDAIILDVDLPDGDGRDLAARLRGGGVKIPIVMLTGSAGEEDIISGLDAGANDYVIKPFRGAELLARLRAQLRSFETSEDIVLRIGPYLFSPSAKLLRDPTSNTRIRLTEKEAAVLKFLYRAKGMPVDRHTLLHEVWGYSPSADSHTVETHIYRLRRKIEPDCGEIRILLNVSGGYRLCGEDWNAPTQAPARRPFTLAVQEMHRAA